jgi:hypothetical protein
MTKRKWIRVDPSSGKRLGVRVAWGMFDLLQWGVVEVALEQEVKGGTTFWKMG